jgi:hypothetical protein
MAANAILTTLLAQWMLPWISVLASRKRPSLAVNGELVDASDLIENDAPSLSSPRKMKKVWRSFVTPVRTC